MFHHVHYALFVVVKVAPTPAKLSKMSPQAVEKIIKTVCDIHCLIIR